MIVTKPGTAPFVIDRRLPRGLFVRTGGLFELVADGDNPMRFPTAEAAERFLRDRLDDDAVEAYEWTILPESETELRELPGRAVDA